ncbi:hypothetical protein SAMN04488515_3420 [Cognatiyoonia koreensis]|uniref:Uncharacterized protein n=1 Tax=Cognatiyoonia koreensis TaxID=364200 RepID=A0A1I0RWR1_9RHOB|nr:hypothetical protein [Cognatiyoonia koreensis]SEW45982.1 hypothetical protein SAMN04488515_3420 [Cognatiyoonia koreensis]
MTYSGLINDPQSGLSPRGPFPLRLAVFTLIAAGLGWAFSEYMPQIKDMTGRAGLGLGLVIALVLLTTHVSYERGQRMFAAVLFAAAFVIGMWGLWIQARFDGLPTVAQLQAAFADTSYSVQSFGKTFDLRGYMFEFWVGLTALFAAVPLLASLSKQKAARVPHNPFDIHPDFADPMAKHLFLQPLLSFGIAAGAVYAYPYLVAYELPLQIALFPPLAAGLLYTKLHMRLAKALIVSIVGGIAGAAGFWLPWHYMTFGQEATLAFVQSAPQQMLAEVQTMAEGYGYVSTALGNTTDYTPWTFEIWAGLTAAYLLLPLVVTLLRRLAPVLRIA